MIRDMPELSTEIDGVFSYALKRREKVDIIQSDSTGPNRRKKNPKTYCSGLSGLKSCNNQVSTSETQKGVGVKMKTLIC